MTAMPALMRAWSELPAPAVDDLVGDFRAEFVRPLRHLAPAALSMVGLPRWYGKRFAPASDGGPDTVLDGINLLRPKGGGSFEERLPMRVVVGTGLADGRPAVVVTYAADAPRPLRWVRDELRTGHGGALVGMSYVDRPALRRAGLPFLLIPSSPLRPSRARPDERTG